QPGITRSVEAELMDWADDVTYAVHDVEDFYRAGRIPLDKLKNDPRERDRFLSYASSRYAGRDLPWKSVADGFTELVTSVPLNQPYSSTRNVRAGLRNVTGVLIGRYINSTELRQPTSS